MKINTYKGQSMSTKDIKCWKLADVIEILKNCDYKDNEIKNLFVIKKEDIKKPPNPFEIMSFKNLDWR